eukprot:TRINITY_DN7644_c0_g1_i1.p1 TRINITY_DN7644_c0_g1~~TRINITY_DN7644_c0_g1_i1.p1  ORF type:complete len:421 (-),score=51.35 TRINITY_DN7644_c0_g1_i1:63-1325(-)
MRNWSRCSVVKISPRNNHKWKQFATLKRKGTEPSYHRTSLSYWDNRNHHREFFDHIFKSLGFTSFQDWYKLSAKDVTAKGGAGLLNHFYGGSLVKALKAVYPDHEWKIWNFKPVPTDFWNDKNNQKAFFDDLFRSLNYENWQDWYKIRGSDIAAHGGGGLLTHHYAGSPVKALTSVYPDHPWVIWKFQQVPRKFWTDQANQRTYFDLLAKQLNLKTWEDWYTVKASDIINSGGGAILAQYNRSLISALTNVYKEYPWNKDPKAWKQVDHFDPSSRTMKLFDSVRKIFKEDEVKDILLHHQDAALVMPTGEPLGMDIYVPSLKLAFDYHGEQRYFDSSYSTSEEQRKKDEIKRQACRQAGVTLIEIPFWWDETLGSLAATIRSQIPRTAENMTSLVESTTAEPIPATLPMNYIQRAHPLSA